MLLLECGQIQKYFGDRLIVKIDRLKIDSKDRIGIVGANGAVKTTLINLLSQRLEPDQGWVKRYGRWAYISQLGGPEKKIIDGELASKFGIANIWNENMSGGEKNRFKMAEALSRNSELLFADEPTSNVDMEGIEIMERMLKEYKGALILISHDRDFLDHLCNKIWEIEDGKIKIYRGNYSDYCIQKRQERERAQFEYDQYEKEKKRLEEAMEHIKQRARSIKRPPKRMGNSEARLHKMGGQKAKATLDRAVKNIEMRMKNLEKKEKPKQQERIQLEIADSNQLYSKIVIEGEKVNKKFGEKILFEDAEFRIYNGSKIALIGPNGCGKSTLMKMIIDRDKGIKIAHGAKIGYFSQDMRILEEDLSILENVMKTSKYPETFVRTFLARLLFKQEDVYKKISVLSGGERVKVSFAKILLQDIHLLLLDEPTNYMDIHSIEVIEEALRAYDGTLLFVSHDRRLINAVADHIMAIENHKIRMFKGNYQEYLASKEKFLEDGVEENEEQILILENRISEIIGRLSMPSPKDDIEALDKEYHEIMAKLKSLKKDLS